MMKRFRDRTDAGQQLATQLQDYANRTNANRADTNRTNTIVLGLPRGGVPVAYEVAKALNLPLDICLVRKLGVPDHPEFAMGAIAEQGVCILDNDIINWLKIGDRAIEQVLAKEKQELQRRRQIYGGDRPQPNIQGRTVILVDDGLATGATMQAALSVLQVQQPKEIVVAVPIAPLSVCQALQNKGHQVICLATPHPFHAIGLWYENFAQTSDQQVCSLLAESRKDPAEFINIRAYDG
jgi:putative phosphoribosyl transferase